MKVTTDVVNFCATARRNSFSILILSLAAYSLLGSQLFGQKLPDTGNNVVTAPSNELLIFLQPNQDATQFAQQNGLTLKHGLQSDATGFVFSAATSGDAATLVGSLKNNQAVVSVNINEKTQHVVMAFTPNDPFYPKDGGGAGQPGQWHLNNQFVAGRDVRITGAWNNNFTGQGVTIGIVDDSLETAHPDLAANYVAGESFNFGSYTGAGAANNPNPRNNGTSASDNSQDRHGVSVAGVAAARGGNGIGGTGAAPLAGLSGLRVDFPTQTTAMFVDATLYHSSGANTNIAIKNHSYGISAPFIATPAEKAAFATSASAGTIHVVAAGNERGTTGEDSNKKDNQSSTNVITVAALGSDGKFASYSSFGANVFVTAPSSSNAGFGITTTDRTGANVSPAYNYGYNGFPGDFSYTDDFGGTSSATPLVAGVLALTKQAQPNLNERFAKHLLVKTSDVVDAADASAMGGWVTNAAGNKFNANYGFGLIDATDLTQQAPLYSGVTSLLTATTGNLSVAASIPDANLTGISRTVSITSSDPLEDVLATMSITHPYRGDLEAYLTSPLGTISRLFFRSGSDNGDNINWTFDTNAFWGENPFGQWSMRVVDNFAADLGTWNSWSLNLNMGSLIAVPEPGTWILAGVGLMFFWKSKKRFACAAQSR